MNFNLIISAKKNWYFQVITNFEILANFVQNGSKKSKNLSCLLPKKVYLKESD